MTTPAQQELAAPAFEPSDRVPIADLTPSPPGSSSYILAVVALVWPYSSSTATLALLLADSDVRVRKSKGQAKVVFRGGCAREVARTKVGIGDVVRLALVGCEWKETGDTVATPGKKIDWDLEYRSRIILQVSRDNNETATVDYTTTESDSPVADEAQRLHDSVQDVRPRPNGVTSRETSTITLPFLTPSKSPRKPAGGAFFGVLREPFSEDDGYVVGRGRKRTKFARHSGTWNLVGSEEEPEPQSGLTAGTENGETSSDIRVLSDQEITPTSERMNGMVSHEQEKANTYGLPAVNVPSRTFADGGEGEIVDISSPPQPAKTMVQTSPLQATTMGPPQTPLRAQATGPPASSEFQSISTSDEDAGLTTTPRLHPLASPGLPLISPLIRRYGVETGYFGKFEADISPLDASAEREAEQTKEDTVALNEISDSSDASDTSPVAPQAQVFHEPELLQTSHAPQAADQPYHAAAIESPRSTEYQSPGGSPMIPHQPLGNSISEQWLTSMEATITEELLQSEYDATVPVVSERAVRAPETEDDDLYGAPTHVLDDTAHVPNVYLPEAGSNPINTMEQFLDLSPVAVVAPNFDNGSNVIRGMQEPVFEYSASVEFVTAAIKGDGDVSAAEPQSQDSYPALSFQSQTYRHSQTASRSPSRRSSSGVIQVRALDGNVDEYESPLVDTTQIAEHSQGYLTFATESHVEIKSLEDAFESHEAEETISKDVLEPTTDEADGPAKPAPEESADPSIPALLVGHSHPSDTQFQVPTPDHTQREHHSPDHQSRVELSEPQPEILVGLPSPRQTQEDSTVLVIEEAPMAGATEHIATPDAVAGTPKPDMDTSPPRRTSQRLSIRKSIMTTNIASPYFTPRTPRQVALSSPARKENIAPSKENVGSLASSPKQADPGSTVIVASHQNSGDNDTGTVVIRSSSDSLKPPKAEPLSRRQTGTTTSFAYYPDLNSLHEHFGQLVDIIAVCTEDSPEPERAKSGPKDYHTTLRLCDSSLDSKGRTAVPGQIFRPVKQALPSTRRGDVVILRSFKVQTLKRKVVLISTDTSSWAVFRTSLSPKSAAWSEVVVSGPPIEYGLAETEHAKTLLHWWRASGEEHWTAKPTRVNQGERLQDSLEGTGAKLQHGTKVADPPTPKLPPAGRRSKNMTDQFANEDEGPEPSDEVPNESTPLGNMTNRRRGSTISIAPSSSVEPTKEFTPRRSARNKRSPSVVHELRDGTKYVDDEQRRSASVVHSLRDGATYVDE